MKKFLFVLLLTLFVPVIAWSQSGFSTGNYYQQEYYIEDVPVSNPYPKYDYFGNYQGTFQTWKKANWNRQRGGEYVNYWTSNGWQSQWREGYFYWYNWMTYERFVGW